MHLLKLMQCYKTAYLNIGFKSPNNSAYSLHFLSGRKKLFWGEKAYVPQYLNIKAFLKDNANKAKNGLESAL